MANRITLRHGSTAPSASNLLPYELGWNENNLGLYIGQPSGEPLLISSGGGNVTGVKGSAEQNYRHGNVELTAANIGLGNVENTKLSTWSGSTNITTLGTITTGIIPWARISDIPAISIATDSGTSSITLAASTKYKLTAAGSSYVFTTPPNTWNALSTSQAGYVAKAPNDTGKFLRGDATWAAVTASNVGLGNVENTKLSTWAGSSNITTLGTISTGTIPWARLSNVPSSFTPASHSHGNIANGGTIASTTVALANGDMLLFSDSSNSGKIERSSITIGTGTNTYLRNDGTWATPSDTDTKVKQSGSTTASWRKILLHYTADNTSTTAVTTTTNEIYAAVGISVQPSTGTLRASVYNVSDNATIQYNSTNSCLEIIV